jgi:parvulin-like peptidyl-prolyl isomerase
MRVFKPAMRFLLIAFLIGLTLQAAAVAADAPITTGAAALVNGATITTAEYQAERARLLRLRKKTEQELETAARAMVGKEALENLIGRELLCQESRRKGIRIQASVVEAEVAMLRGKYSSAEEFIASLGKMGLTEQAMGRHIEQGMAIQGLIDAEFGGKTTVSEEEALSYYTSHRIAFLEPVRIRLSHILAAVDPSADVFLKEKSRKKIEALRKRIMAGEDFEALAVESDDTTSNTKGGDLGYSLPNQLGKGIEEAAFSLKVGQLSAIVEDRFGYHLLKVTERRSETVLPFEDVKGRISAQLQRERTNALMGPYLKQLRGAARVEIQLGAAD